MIPRQGTCRYCLRQRPVYPIRRHGGGTYRRGSRWYPSQLCGECAVEMGQRGLPTHAGAKLSGFNVRTIRLIIEAEDAAVQRPPDGGRS